MTCVLLVVCLMGGPTYPPQPAQTPTPAPKTYYASRVAPELFGADVGELKGTPLQANRSQQLGAARGGGIGVVRRVAAWNEIEPNAPNGFTGAHTYTWTEYDAFARDVATAGLRWQPFFWTPPCWATAESAFTCDQQANRSTYAPARRSDFNALVTAFAQRYGRNGSFWSDNPGVPYVPVTSYEIWNEENQRGSWGPNPDPSSFGALLLEARWSITNIDPQAKIVVGGLAREDGTTTDMSGVKNYQDSGYLAALYQAVPSLRTYGSSITIGYHPYASDETAQEAVADIEGRVANLRRTINDPATVNHPSAQIAITELGWATQGTTHNVPVLPEVDGTSGRPYALSTVANALARSNCGIGQFIVQTWVTPETPGSNDKLDWMGIYAADATPHKAGTAYVNQVMNLQGQNPAVDPTTDPAYAPTVSIC